jgi:hypothetical protein
MLSRVIPLEYLKERDLMFWLPPGGQDNEVWADTWVILAELEAADVAPVLALLHDADVGAYVAGPSGLKGAANRGVRLYVDREQHSRAVDVVMLFLRGKDESAVPVKASKPAPKVRPKVKRRSVRILLTAIQVAAFAALIALGLLLAYYRGPSLFPTVHPAHHPAPVSDAPGMNGSHP